MICLLGPKKQLSIVYTFVQTAKQINDCVPNIIGSLFLPPYLIDRYVIGSHLLLLGTLNNTIRAQHIDDKRI